MNYRIKKVKRGDGIELSYEKLNKNFDTAIAEISLKTSRISASNLINSLHALKEELLKMAEVKVEDEQILSVTQVNFKYSSDKGLGAQMTAELFLKDSNENLVIKSPVKWEDSKEVKERMSHNLLTLLNEVRYEACEFIDREKDDQIELFQEANKEAS